MTNPPDPAPRRETPTDGTLAVVQRGCATCSLIEPVLAQLPQDVDLTIVSQDAPDFPDGVGSVIDDRDLGLSYGLGIETVPTLLSFTDGRETDRVVGWDRQRWEAVTGASPLGPDLPGQRPGCGSLSVEPNRARKLRARFEGGSLAARRVEIADLEDEIESIFERGWTDGLPVVPATEERVLAMLDGTSRQPGDVVAVVPPDLAPCTVEKAAINAVMAGCKAEYLPVVLAAVEAACMDESCMHGLLATTWFSGPMIVVNGPIRKAIGMILVSPKNLI